MDEALKIGFVPNEAYCDPYMLGTFFARCARKHGAKIRQGVEVLGLIHEGGNVKGVKTAEGDIYADTVVDAAGVWAPILAKEMGVRPSHGTSEKSILDYGTSRYFSNRFAHGAFAGCPSLCPS